MSNQAIADIKVAYLGLGVMGGPMAGHLSTAGYQVSVYNRTRSKAEAWSQAHGGDVADKPADAVREADFVCACVGKDDDLREITLGEQGAFPAMKPGAIFIDHTTASADVARELSGQAGGLGIGFLDAPVSGGQAGAENGKLTVMVGGEADHFAAAKVVMECYALAVTHMGSSGAGQLTKMVNQICIAGVLQGLSEGINFASKADLDVEKVLSVISKGAAQSWQMENRGVTMSKDQFDFGFAVDWMRKDLGLCFDEARGNGARLPMAMLVDQFYAHVQERGGGRWDTSSLIRLLTQP